jgi:hypothetical protein
MGSTSSGTSSVTNSDKTLISLLLQRAVDSSKVWSQSLGVRILFMYISSLVDYCIYILNIKGCEVHFYCITNKACILRSLK